MFDISSSLQSLPLLQGDNLVGPLVYIALLVVAQVFILPITAFDLTAGLLFSFKRAVVIMLIGKAFSAWTSYQLARSIAKKPAQRLAAKFPLIAGLQTAIGSGGWKLAALVRLCPLPFGIVSYAFGLSRLPSLPHIFATFIAVIPPTLIFTGMGSSMKESLASLHEHQTTRSPWSTALSIAGIIIAFFVIRHVSKLAIKAVNEAQNSRQTDTN